MSETIKGLPELNKRLRAIGNTRAILQKLQTDTTYEAKRLVRRKTGNLGRSIQPGYLRDREALVTAQAGYAAFVELGTKAHEIRPRNRKVLRFAARGVPVTLAGRVTSAAARKGGAYVFAAVVHHPGTKAQPFLVPGAEKAVRNNHAGKDIVIKLWDGAA